MRPDQVGLIKAEVANDEADWQYRAYDQARRLLLAMPTGAESISLVIEMPILFAGTAGGMAAAGNNSLQKLCAYVGMVTGLAMASLDKVAVRLVSVRDWKGQLPKDVVKKRIIKALGAPACLDFKLDVWDAVGIGLWAQGVKL
jgi:hypothetical protein